MIRSDVPADAPADRPALEFAGDRVTVAPDATAATARDLAIDTDARRLPVVDADEHLHGVVAVTTDLQFFACRPRPGRALTPSEAARPICSPLARSCSAAATPGVLLRPSLARRR